jgi:hypothetical protein
MVSSSESKLKAGTTGEILLSKNGGVASMDSALPDARVSFRGYFIRMNGPESDPMVRMLLVETSKAQSIYEGFGSLSQCERWIVQLTGWIIPRDVLSVLRKRLKQRQMVTIKGVRVSRREIESIGLQRSDR